MEKIEEKLPSDFYEKRYKWSCINFPYDPCQIKLHHDTLYYVPLKDNFPVLDSLEKRSNSKDISLLYVYPMVKSTNKNESTSVYPLETMFECYKDSFPNYNYNEFKMIVLNELQSMKNDQEVLEYFVEIFGFEAIEFLTEIISHRNNKIDYAALMNGKLCMYLELVCRVCVFFLIL